MPVTIRIFGEIAKVVGYKWHCTDPEVLDMLQVTLHPDGPWGSDPNPDYTVAKDAIEFYCNGEILEHEKMERDGESLY
jgi:hypothetical protein